MFSLFDRQTRLAYRGLGFRNLLRRATNHRWIELRRRDALPRLTDGTELIIEPVGPVFGLRQKLCSGLGSGVGLGRSLGRTVGVGFGGPDGIGGRDHSGLGLGDAFVVTLASLGQSGFFGRQPLVGRRGVVLQLIGVGQVLADLHDPALRLTQGDIGLLFLGGDLLLRQAMAFQHGAGVAFRFAQRRQRSRCFGGRGGRGSRGVGRVGNRHFGGVQRRGGRGADLVNPSALQRQQIGLGLPDRARDIAIPAGLPRLAFQVAQLAFQLRA